MALEQHSGYVIKNSSGDVVATMDEDGNLILEGDIIIKGRYLKKT